jgi:hypothetical protein
MILTILLFNINMFLLLDELKKGKAIPVTACEGP